MVLWAFGHVKLTTDYQRDRILSFRDSLGKGGLYHARFPLLILMQFVSQPAWVFNRFLDSFPNQPSLFSVIEGGCKPVIKTIYINLCVVHI